MAADPAPSRELEEPLALIDAVIYADVFGCAVTEQELWRYSRRPVTLGELQRRLEDDAVLRRAVCRRDGLYCLTGREPLADLRQGRRRRALTLRRRARAVARVLQYMPFVRGLLLTGSAAADDAPEGADVDLLVIVTPRRMSLVFTLLGSLSRLLSPSIFCPNHYLCESALELTRRRDLYIAREVAQARALTAGSEAFAAANGWVRSVLPNAAPRHDPVRPLPGGRVVQRALEWPLRGRLGDALERRLRRLALARLAAHYGRWDLEVPDGVVDGLMRGTELRFHGIKDNQEILARYENRRSEVEGRLAG